MNRRLKISLVATVSVAAAVFIFAAVYFFMPGSSDYGTFLKMRKLQMSFLDSAGAGDRAESDIFKNYTIKLPAVYAFMFKSRELSLFLKSVSSDRIEAATVNQLEIGRDTGNFFDFTFMIRPKPEYNVPFFHGDALKPMPGVDGALYMDFYSFEDTVKPDQFFQGEIEKLERAVELAQPYWKSDGFGELTPHLDPYKSRWRLEMVEPKNGSTEDQKKYFETVLQCFSLYLEAYLNALGRAEAVDDSQIIEKNKSEIKNFVSVLYRHDIAVKMGKMIFPEKDFDAYFLDAFWGVGKLQLSD